MAANRPRVEMLEIDDLKTLKVLTDPNRLAILEALSEPSSVTELADVLGVPRTRLYHHIKLLEEHGLIRVVSTRKRGSLAEKVYEPSAHAYTPGPKLLQSDDRQEQVEAIIAGVLDTTREDLRLSLLRYGIEDLPGDPQRNSLNRSVYRLRPDEADALVGELAGLLERYSGLHAVDDSAEDTRLYALTLLFYPSSRNP